MNTTRAIGGKNVNKKGEINRSNTETKLIWIPGIRPVIVPIAIPKSNAIIISINILFLRGFINIKGHTI